MIAELGPGWSYGLRPDAAALAEVYDVCIVGSGAAGAVAADVLVKAGLTVIMVERGAFLPRDAEYDDVIMRSEMALARTESGTWAPIGYPWSTCNVGGGTVFYGGASFRYRVTDFEAGGHMTDTDLIIDWPFGYDTLAPHYDAVEERLGIAADPANDPTAPPARHKHLLPPVELSQAGRLIDGAARSRGLRPFPTPLAVLTRPRPGRSECRQESPCIEFACASGAKGDTRTVFLDPLAGNPSFNLFAGLCAARLIRRTGREVGALEAIDLVSSNTLLIRARRFVLAANAIQTAALLLRSADTAAPDGMGNGSGLVGRGLCFKANGHVVGFTRRAEPSERRGGPFSTVSLTDHYIDVLAPAGLGGLLYEGGYGFAHAKRPDEAVVRIEALVPDQPSAANRVRLGPGTTRLGLPNIALGYNTHPRDTARLIYMLDRAHELVADTGCQEIWRETEAFHLGSCHLHGTCRAAHDPANGVVNANGRVHDLDNVFVADGGFLPFPAGVNPTLTIQAVAHLVASRMAQGWQ